MPEKSVRLFVQVIALSCTFAMSSAYGSPCRVIREIGERDMKYYFRDWEIDPEI